MDSSKVCTPQKCITYNEVTDRGALYFPVVDLSTQQFLLSHYDDRSDIDSLPSD